MTTPEATRELIHWMRSNGWSRDEVAQVTDRSVRTVSRIVNRRHLSKQQVALIRQLRSDGYSLNYVAFRLGVSASTVRRIAPGRPGKVPVAPLREAFLASGIPASEVARRVGWLYSRTRGGGDGSRVKRTLGIRPDTSGSPDSVRTWVDIETVSKIAEAIGVAPWSVLPNEDER